MVSNEFIIRVTDSVFLKSSDERSNDDNQCQTQILFVQWRHQRLVLAPGSLEVGSYWRTHQLMRDADDDDEAEEC